MNFRVLPEAQGEAIEAANWYDDRQPDLGMEFLEEIRQAFDIIRNEADSLPRLETYTGTHDIRRVLLKRFPYAIIVLCRSNEMVVVAIAHTRRRPLYWLERFS